MQLCLTFSLKNWGEKQNHCPYSSVAALCKAKEIATLTEKWRRFRVE